MSRATRRTNLAAAIGGTSLYMLGLEDVVRAFGWQFALIVMLALTGAVCVVALAAVWLNDERAFRSLLRERTIRELQEDNDKLRAAGGADLQYAQAQDALLTAMRLREQEANDTMARQGEMIRGSSERINALEEELRVLRGLAGRRKEDRA